MRRCEALGFTLQNTPGVDEIKPRAMGMKGHEVDFDTIEKGGQRSEIKPKTSTKRVDLSSAPQYVQAEYIPTRQGSDQERPEDFIQLDVGEGQGFETLNYNHKLRRKLHRAIERAEVGKEMLVRQRALSHYNEKEGDAPAVLHTGTRAVNVKGQRILENGILETAKQERVRTRIELAEFNNQMRVLRRQAKETATYAGLRKYAEVVGRIPTLEPLDEQEAGEPRSNSEQHCDPETVQSNIIIAPVLKRKRSESNTESGSECSNSRRSPQSELSGHATSDSTSSVSSGSFRGVNKDHELSINSARLAMITADADDILERDFRARRKQQTINVLQAADGNANCRAR